MMRLLLHVLTLSYGLIAMAAAAAGIDEDVLGQSLGGWKTYSKKYAQYTISGVKYRTYRPEATITPDAGTYVSIRIDHVRGWFSSDDHAILEITVDRNGHIVSAQSTIAIQGQSVSSDVIMGANKASKSSVSSIDRAVQIGTDLVANLSSKLLRAKLVEPGRVSFPSAVRHNYNLLYQAIRVDGKPVAPLKLRPEVLKPEEVKSPVEKPAAEAAAGEKTKTGGAAGEKSDKESADPEKADEEKADEPAAPAAAEPAGEAQLVIRSYSGVPAPALPKKQ